MPRLARPTISVPAPSVDDTRWAAVASRDKRCDGTFVYSVATTGVYCMPSCPSRAAKRSNVEFHETCAAAEAAGFRACKRCKPGSQTLGERQAALVAAACRAIERADKAPPLDDLAQQAGLSPYHFHRVFKATAGVTPKAYAVAHRHKRVRENLAAARSVTEAIYESGFESSGRFYAETAGMLGMSAAAFKSGGAGADMMFAVGMCSLGSILVAATKKGVAAILLGDDPSDLLRDLQDRFPKANLIGGDTTFETLAARAVSLVERPGQPADLPLDVQGTVFQRRVWEALRTIPAGTTTSYAEVARRIGAPKSVRAVARACGANPVAVVVPCHRVVRTDGSLSGYRWGLERKRALLDRETEIAAPVSNGKRRG